MAIRDSEIAAQSMGVNLAAYKTLAFAYSAALMGAAGALFAHKIGFLAPDIFSVLFSIQFLLMVVVGGLGSLHGALYGAVFVALLPVLISEARDSVGPLRPGPSLFGAQRPAPSRVRRPVRQAAGARARRVRLILVFIILFEPLGIYGRWINSSCTSHVPLQARDVQAAEDVQRSERLR